jgi:hypothetical protein
MVFLIEPSVTQFVGFLTLIFAIALGLMVNYTYNSYIYLNMPFGRGLTLLNLSQLTAFLMASVLAYWLGWHSAKTSSAITIETV